MIDKVKAFAANWKTSIAGLIALLCASDQLIHFLPDVAAQYLLATCGFAVAIGLIAAKDADKSNAAHPTTAAVTVK